MESQETSILSSHIVYNRNSVLSSQKKFFFSKKAFSHPFLMLEQQKKMLPGIFGGNFSVHESHQNETIHPKPPQTESRVKYQPQKKTKASQALSAWEFPYHLTAPPYKNEETRKCIQRHDHIHKEVANLRNPCNCQ